MSNYEILKSLRNEHELLVVQKINLKEELSCVSEHIDGINDDILEYKRKFCDQGDDYIRKPIPDERNNVLKSFRDAHKLLVKQKMNTEKKLRSLIEYIDRVGDDIHKAMTVVEDKRTETVDEKQSGDDTMSDDVPVDYVSELTSLRQSIEKLTESAEA